MSDLQATPPKCPYGCDAKDSVEVISQRNGVGARWCFCRSCAKLFLVDRDGHIIREGTQR